MTQFYHANERVKHRYFSYLKEAMGYSEPSIDQVVQAIGRFEAYTGAGWVWRERERERERESRAMTMASHAIPAI
jgi:hypothetical protein